MAAEAIKAEIAAGRWTDRLPGIRVLATEIGVSQPTLATALAKLAEEKVLGRGGDRKAYRILAGGTPSASKAPTEAPRVIVLSHLEFGELPESARTVIEEMRHLIGKHGWSVELRVVDYVHAKQPHRSWDDLIPTDPFVPLIAVFGRPVIARWAQKHGLRMIFLGGIREGHTIPVVAVRSASMVDDAFSRLIALGHRQIVIPLCERLPPFSNSIKEVVRERLEGAGVTYVASYHTPESDYMSPEVTWRMMEAIFARTPPTALVFLDWKELVTSCCLLWQLGMRVPDDVSVVLLNEQTEAGWFMPKLASFRFPTRRMAMTLAAWVEGRTLQAHQQIHSADFDEGETMREVTPRP